MEERKTIVYNKIDNCISTVNKEIDLHLRNREAAGDIDALKAIKIELERMKSALSPKVFYPTYDYIIRDNLWDYMRLSGELLDVYYSYIKL